MEIVGFMLTESNNVGEVDTSKNSTCFMIENLKVDQ